MRDGVLCGGVLCGGVLCDGVMFDVILTLDVLFFCRSVVRFLS